MITRLYASVALLLLLIACGRHASMSHPGSSMGDPSRGKELINYYGCAGCHTIAGINKGSGLVGPPLNGIRARSYVGGVVENTPANMSRWIQNPQEFSPRTAMPNLRITEGDARDITAYLYTLN